MPEIAEVARIVHYIKEHLVGKTLAVVKAPNDDIIFGKVGTSGAEFEKTMKGKKIVDAGQQGKYFWMIMSSPPHPVLHFGMNGWFNIRGVQTGYYRNPKPETEQWPPKFWKFSLETEAEGDAKPVEAAFVDSRRLSRIRLVNCDAKNIRKTTPLKENGPDPVIDKDILTEAWLTALCKRKKVPIKAMLLDQANISGIGNWVGDEILYNARIHPEQYANTLTNQQLKTLHKSMMEVTKIAVDTLADSSKFPKDWLMLHRWGKGKKGESSVLPSGQKITFLTVGGRTSAVVPALQKKTGPVAGDVKADDGEDEAAEVQKEGKAAKGKPAAGKRKRDVKAEEDEDEEVKEEEPAKPVKAAMKKGKKGDAASDGEESASKKRKAADLSQYKAEEPAKSKEKKVAEESIGRRRSGRVSGKSG